MNLRGSDIQYNPVFFAYLLLDFSEAKNQGVLFIENAKLDEHVAQYLAENGIQIAPYNSIASRLLMNDLILSLANLNHKIYSSLPASNSHIFADPIIDLLKEVKSPHECEMMKDCHVHDGAALVSLLAYIYDVL